MQPEIIYEDSDLLVVNKPSGWIVNDANTVKDVPVLQSWLNQFNYPIANNKEYRSGIVHRLDKETSGIILVAKTIIAFTGLQEEFKERTVKKYYLALVHGELVNKEGTIEVPVGRLPWNRERFGILPGGRDSKTDYFVLNNYMLDKMKYSLVRFEPKTGRTHQIRIHAKYLGHPLVGDNFYAGRKTSRNDRKWCPRLFLHAAGIKFIHPNTKKFMEFSLELPEDLKNIINYLEKQLKTS
jgi:23S rRNA pseudouridine1911/1915/1917 synthase